MTVSYSEDIATSGFHNLIRLLLFRWRGSVMKLLWIDSLLYLGVYFFIKLIYKSMLGEGGVKDFESLVKYARTHESAIPISFVLGFFVSNVTVRWWDQYLTIPWPYSIAVYVSSTLHGYDEVGRAMRRTIMRYVCLSLTMVFRVLSKRVQKRFPKMSDLVEAGLLTQSELTIIEELDKKYSGYSKNWLPIVWAASLVNRARREGRITDDFAVKTLIEELNKFRGSCGVLMNYNSICIPLVYLQVVTIAVWSYFVVGLVSHQYVTTDTPSGVELLDHVPLLKMFQFIFYMGWLKVAETMINPFGEDDDDFEVNFMIDRNLIMSYLIVDEMHEHHPELLKDQYWDEIPKNLPDNYEKEEKKEKERPNEPADIFDVGPKQSIMRRATFVDDLRADIEASSQSFLPVKKLITPHQSMVPRASVIDGSYLKLKNVEVKQSSLNIGIIEKKISKPMLETIESDLDDESIKSTIQESFESN